MKLLGMVFVLCCLVVAGPNREMNRLSKGSDIKVTENLKVASLSETKFECMDEGVTGSSLCWTKDGTEICAAGVHGDYIIVDTGVAGFGERSLGHAKTNCLSDTSSHLLLTFDPPMGNIQLSMQRDQFDELRIVVWFDPDSVGDEDLGTPFEPSNPDADTWHIGLGVNGGIAGCAVYGIADNVLAY